MLINHNQITAIPGCECARRVGQQNQFARKQNSGKSIMAIWATQQIPNPFLPFPHRCGSKIEGRKTGEEAFANKTIFPP
jgi:hypothetical protein